MPIETMLWLQLGRRAAGVFLRDHEGADPPRSSARAPMKCHSWWSKSRTNSESQLPELEKLTPERVFEASKHKNALSKLSPRWMVRINCLVNEPTSTTGRLGLIQRR
jgi:hypothetical protein